MMKARTGFSRFFRIAARARMRSGSRRQESASFPRGGIPPGAEAGLRRVAIPHRPDDAVLRVTLCKSAKAHGRLYRHDGGGSGNGPEDRFRTTLPVRRRHDRKRALGTRAPLLTGAVANTSWSVASALQIFGSARIDPPAGAVFAS